MISTRIVKLDPLNPQEDYIKEAARILSRGGLVIMPTETVYGIGANMCNRNTIERLCAIKNRPKDKLFSLHIDEKGKIEDFAHDIPIGAYKLMDKFWPGPLTLVLKAKNNHSNQSIGIRMPDDEIALRLISLAGVPVVCPSANISGKPAPVNFPDAIKDLEGLVDFAIDAGITRLQVESSVVDFTVKPLEILREGAIKKEDIEAVIAKKNMLFVCTGNSCRSVMAGALLKKKLKERNRQDVEVSSAGIMMLNGLGATPETGELLKREGIDVSEHHSQAVTKELIGKSDLILVMEKAHEHKLLQLAPEAKNRVFLLKEFARINGELDIRDPIGKPIEFYAQIFAIIKEAIERVIDII